MRLLSSADRRRYPGALCAATALLTGMLLFVTDATRGGESVPPKPGNLLKNPSFTDGPAQWQPLPIGDTPLAQAAVDRSVFRGADMASLRLVPETGKRVYLNQAGIPRDPRAKRYRVSAWRRCEGVPAGWEAGVCLNWSGTQSLCIPGKDWVFESRTVDAPPGDGPLTFQVYLRYVAKAGEPAPPGGGSVWYDDVALEPVVEGAAPAAPAPAAVAPRAVAVSAFVPAGEKGLFLPGRPVRLLLQGKCREPAPKGLQVDVKVEDFWGKPAGSAAVKVAPGAGGEFEQAIDLPAPGALGFFRVVAQIRQDGVLAAWPETGFCVVQPTEKRDPYFGIDANGLTASFLEAYRLMGAGSLGISQSWAVPDEAVGHEDEFMRAQWEERWAPFHKSDFTLIGYVKIDPGFHAPRHQRETSRRRAAGLFAYPDTLFAELGDAVEAEAKVMKDRVRTWIICEEIDAWVQNPAAPAGSGTSELARHILMTRIAYQRLKKVDPDFFVPGLAVCMDYASDPPYRLVRSVARDLKDYVDAIAVHPYCGNHRLGVGAPDGPEAGRLREVLLSTRQLQKQWGKTDTLIIPEKGLGVPYHAPLDSPLQRVHADLHARNLIVAKSAAPVAFNSLHMAVWNGLARQFKSGSITSTDAAPFTDYGLWKHVLDGQDRDAYIPRPAVAAYATVARVLANADDIEPVELRPREGFYGYLFRRGDTSIAAVWTTDADPCTVRIPLPAPAECIDLMGNARKLAAGDAELTLSGSPLFLRTQADPKAVAAAIEKAAFPGLPLLNAEGHLSDLSTLTISLLNQTRAPVEAEVAIRPPAAVRLPVRERKVTVPASGRAAVDFALAGADPAALASRELSAEIRAGGMSTTVKPDLAFTPVARAPRGIRVDGDLSEYAGIVPLLVDSPFFLYPPTARMPESHLWDGAKDLGVTCWLAWDEKSLYVAARVTDDVHLQRQRGETIWMDDCFQLAVDARNDALSPQTTGRQAGYDADDHNLGMALTAEGPQCICWVERGDTKAAGPSAYPLAIKRDGGVTVYELAIPWAGLAPLAPTPGKAFAFSFVVFDNDRAEDRQAAYHMALTPGIADGQDPSAYRTFVLAP